MKLLVPVVGILVLAGIGIAWFNGEKKLSAAKDAVAELLNDPESARYRNVRNGKDETVCGEVNAKNRLGGYVGYVRFAVTDLGGGPFAQIDQGTETIKREQRLNEINGVPDSYDLKNALARNSLFEATWLVCEK